MGREEGCAPSSNLRVFGGNMLRAPLGGCRRGNRYGGEAIQSRATVVPVSASSKTLTHCQGADGKKGASQWV